jgi:hypothetical protein
VSQIPAELRGPDVREIRPEQTTSRRMLDLYRRALVIPGTPEQRIPGSPELRIPARPAEVIAAQVRWVGFNTGFGGLNTRVTLAALPAGGRSLMSVEFGVPGNAFRLQKNGEVFPTEAGTFLGSVPAGGSLDIFPVASGGRDATGRPVFGMRVLIRPENPVVTPAVPEQVIPAIPETIIPATPDRFQEGSVVTIAFARQSSVQAGGRSVVHSGIAALGATRLRLQGGLLYGVPVLARAASAPAAIAALRWMLAGLPWWGGAWESALAGQWVRRAAWQDLARAVRYVAGGGTTRAVAVRETGNRVTTADFGTEEFLGTDWELLDGTAEPAEVDVTDWVFSGSGGVPFAVIASPSPTTPTPPITPITPITPTTGLPQTGEGFVYLRNGTPTLVRARKLSDESIWRP